MKKTIIIFTLCITIALLVIIWKLPTATIQNSIPATITNFMECIRAGNPAMESYPRKCNHGGQTFVENIGNEMEKANLVRVSSPRPNQLILSPLVIKGEARGNWFFEASFPVVLTDGTGIVIAQGVAQAKSDWMTTEFVPFEATLTFEEENDGDNSMGFLILKKDNPSGLPENDDALEIPVLLEPAGPRIL